ncbi:hypothetical protein SDC9_93828 [bioreactor metagenome]|uniref:Uncharacterized protein n=1 Tax=bioreactor metagenome TaxID=1076179 RepID=A0A645A1P2_9ZZZZ
MTFYARSIWNIFYGLLKFRFSIPVEVRAVLGQVPPHVADTQCGFSRIVRPRVVLGRQMTVYAVDHYAASVVHVNRKFPTLFRMGVDVAHHARLVSRKINGCLIQCSDENYAYRNT